MIGHGGQAGGAELGGQGLGSVPRAGVDHPRPVAPRLGQLQHPLAARPGLALGGQGQLWPVEGGDELPGLAQVQALADVLPGAGVGGGCHRKARDPREQAGQLAQLPVLRPEVMAPLTDAVRLVDGDDREPNLRQPLQHPGLQQALRRDVEQVQGPGLDPRPGGGPGLRGGEGVQPGRSHPGLDQARHLVGHQGDEGADHQAEAGPQQGGDLVADALAPAGGQDGQGRTPGQDLGDHRRLKPPEAGVSEDTAQDLLRLLERIVGHALLSRGPPRLRRGRVGATGPIPPPGRPGRPGRRAPAGRAGRRWARRPGR